MPYFVIAQAFQLCSNSATETNHVHRHELLSREERLEEAFEHVWTSRDTHLEKVPGFVEFHLLKGPEHDDHTLYCSHTIWQSNATFEAWTRSEEFRAAHRDAGQNKPLYLDHPQFEGFEVRQTVRRASRRSPDARAFETTARAEAR